MNNEKIKTLVQVEHEGRLKSRLKSKLNGGNLVKAVNTYAASVVRYTSGIVKWTKEEQETLDSISRKQLTQYGALHPGSDVNSLYVTRKVGGRGLVSVEDLVRHEEKQLNRDVTNSRETVMQAVYMYERVKMKKADESESRVDKWTRKAMHGQVVRQIEAVRGERSWMWMTRGTMKRETGSLLTAAQDQAIKTNNSRAKIEKDGTSPLCRMHNRANDTLSHIVSEFSKLGQTDTKGRHDKAATLVLGYLAKKHGFPVSDKWVHQGAEATVENEKVKLYWDPTLYTDHVIKAR